MARLPRSANSPRTIYLIKMCELVVRSGIENRLEEFGISGLQYTILSTVSRRDDLSVADLARVTRVTPQSMGEMISGLQERQLVIRREDPSNRRILRIELTPAGRELFEKCDRLVDDLENEILGDMTDKEIVALRSGLNSILTKSDAKPSAAKYKKSSA